MGHYYKQYNELFSINTPTNSFSNKNLMWGFLTDRTWMKLNLGKLTFFFGDGVLSPNYDRKVVI